MTDPDLQKTMNSFGRVWQRVTAVGDGAAANAGHGASPLSRLLKEEQQAAETDACLARRMSGPVRTVLLRHAMGARRRCRRLRAEVFIAEGSCGQGTRRPEPIADAMQALRAAYRRDLAAVRSYGAAAQEADSPALKQMLLRFGQERERAACEKRVVLVACLTAARV